ncbi:MAG: hypothetical protein P8M30_20420 [Planctomycetaceae bacterium]|nr:hypothetical protein [Planctomycetaceae bacterium]
MTILFVVVLLASVPLAAGFHIAGMVVMGWWITGAKGMTIGLLWVPTFLSVLLSWRESKNLRQAVPRGMLTGLMATGVLLLLGQLLLLSMGTMDGGI